MLQARDNDYNYLKVCFFLSIFLCFGCLKFFLWFWFLAVLHNGSVCGFLHVYLSWDFVNLWVDVLCQFWGLFQPLSLYAGFTPFLFSWDVRYMPLLSFSLFLYIFLYIFHFFDPWALFWILSCKLSVRLLVHMSCIWFAIKLTHWTLYFCYCHFSVLDCSFG